MKLLKIGSIVNNNKEITGNVYCHENDDFSKIITTAKVLNDNFVEENCVYPRDINDVLFEKSLNNPKNKIIII